MSARNEAAAPKFLRMNIGRKGHFHVPSNEAKKEINETNE